jgi:hypothetical protein
MTGHAEQAELEYLEQSTGPAPMITTSVTMAGFGEISDKLNSFIRLAPVCGPEL